MSAEKDAEFEHVDRLKDERMEAKSPHLEPLGGDRT